jgi:hypothetical protein
MTYQELFPNVNFAAMSSARIVGASLTVTQTQRLVDRSGYGLIARVYGMPPDPALTNAYSVSKTTVMNSVYKDEANFASQGEDDHLRMIYAPADFTDLHMQSMNIDAPLVPIIHSTMPLIQAFVTGSSAVNPITITCEFNVVFEYVPTPSLYQMVERKPAEVAPSKLAKAENAAGRVDNGMNPQTLSQ